MKARQNRFIVVGSAFLLVLVVGLSVVHAQRLLSQPVGTAFTHEGCLVDANGKDLNGKYDMQFSLYDAAVDGEQVGNTISIEDVVVKSCQFTTQLDFGDDAFNGDSRYLEIAARKAGTDDPQEVFPRQAILATPYALYAMDSRRLNGQEATYYQARVSGECEAGSTIRAISPDGAVVCDLAGGNAFQCVPGGWQHITSGISTVCETTIELPYRAVVVASFTGHWRSHTNGRWCFATVEFDRDAGGIKNFHPANHQFAPAHTYITDWHSVSQTRSAVLDAGSHRISYSLRTDLNTCSLNGSALYGHFFPAR